MIKKYVTRQHYLDRVTPYIGIGLHIVKKAMESYGGYAWVEDNELNLS